jgi:hypothetical protein
MDKAGFLKTMCILLGFIIILNSIFALVNKGNPNGQTEYPGQNMIVSVIYMIMGVVLMGSGLNLDA